MMACWLIWIFIAGPFILINAFIHDKWFASDIKIEIKTLLFAPVLPILFIILLIERWKGSPVKYWKNLDKKN